MCHRATESLGFYLAWVNENKTYVYMSYLYIYVSIFELSSFFIQNNNLDFCLVFADMLSRRLL